MILEKITLPSDSSMEFKSITTQDPQRINEPTRKILITANKNSAITIANYFTPKLYRSRIITSGMEAEKWKKKNQIVRKATET